MSWTHVPLMARRSGYFLLTAGFIQSALDPPSLAHVSGYDTSMPA
jgi:hypothetical protein